VRGAGKLAQIGVVHLQPVHVVQEEPDGLFGAMLIAMPDQPLDPLQLGQQTGALRIVLLRDPAGILAQHRKAHGDGLDP
jgi:hypothetical protein